MTHERELKDIGRDLLRLLQVVFYAILYEVLFAKGILFLNCNPCLEKLCVERAHYIQERICELYCDVFEVLITAVKCADLIALNHNFACTFFLTRKVALNVEIDHFIGQADY